MSHWVIGTAGHVDHGKTTLIRALTHTDTDRLPEEKKRGISIDLGFARFLLPSGREASIVDVPGHERFVKNMVAGVTGMDLVLLVISADEGVMPQTREHLDILQLLGVSNGLVVLNKVDLVDRDWLDLVREEVQQVLRGTFLEAAALVEVSARTGQGIDELKRQLDDMLPQIRRAGGQKLTRLPIDRVFTVQGFGTVVTGTLLGGTITSEQRLEIQPGNLTARVRQIQVHNRTVDRAESGQRVAVNLAGVNKEQLYRGQVLLEPGVLKATGIVAAEVCMLPHAADGLRNNSRVRWHSGTCEILGRVLLLDRDRLEPGDCCPMLFKAETDFVAARGDRFILRSYSPARTAAGGRVLDVDKRYKRFQPQHLQELSLKAAGNVDELLAGLLEEHPAQIGRLAEMLGYDAGEIAPRLESLGERLVRLPDGWWLARPAWERCVSRAQRVLQEFHRKFPLRSGMPREELRLVLGEQDVRTGNVLLEKMRAEGIVEDLRDRVRLSGWQPQPDEGQAQQLQILRRRLRDAGNSPPSPADMASEMNVPHEDISELLRFLSEQGEAVRIESDLYLDREYLDAVICKVREYLGDHGEMTMAEFRDLLQTTRKYAVPLAEYLDAIRVTRRSGDKRVLF